ncbi:MAG: hypothetical protein PVG14_15065 [Anaerolineales bacterium]|jgi:hypothetical protein
MVRFNDTLWCDGCGVEIPWGEMIIGGKHYCCQDCFEGLPCECGERAEADDERREEETPAVSSKHTN